jgi:hypothetical protein
MTELEGIRINADTVVRELGPLSGLGTRFGFNRVSVEWVEGYIERLRDSGIFKQKEALENLTSVLGSFLGECIAQTYNGEWRNEDGRWGVYFSNKSTAFPFSKVVKQLTDGLESGDSILGFFDMIPEVLLVRNK